MHTGVMWLKKTINMMGGLVSDSAEENGDLWFPDVLPVIRFIWNCSLFVGQRTWKFNVFLWEIYYMCSSSSRCVNFIYFISVIKTFSKFCLILTYILHLPAFAFWIIIYYYATWQMSQHFRTSSRVINSWWEVSSWKHYFMNSVVLSKN